MNTGKRRFLPTLLILLVGLATAGTLWAAVAAPTAGVPGEPLLRWISVGTVNPVDSNDTSSNVDISANGRYVVFQSDADNLVAGDTNGVTDIFLTDQVTGITTRVSVGPGGAESNGKSINPAISADGRFVAFKSVADNLDANDNNGIEPDVFVRELEFGLTEWIPNSRGVNNLDISADGRYVVYDTNFPSPTAVDSNGTSDVVHYDRQLDVVSYVSLFGDGSINSCAASNPSVSADGQSVTYQTCEPISDYDSAYTDTNAQSDVIVREVPASTSNQFVTTSPTLVSHAVGSTTTAANNQSYSAVIDADGRYVVFYSIASDLTAGGSLGTQLYDLQTQTMTWVSNYSGPRLSANGRFISHVNNSGFNTRVTDWQTGVYTTTYSPNVFSTAVSNDGRFVAFDTDYQWEADDMNGAPDVYLRDTTIITPVRRLSQQSGMPSNDRSNDPALTGDGRTVYFYSEATNLVPGGPTQPYLYRRDLDTRETEEVRINRTEPAVSDDGEHLAYILDSTTSSLAYESNVFATAPTLYTVSSGSLAHPDISGDGTQARIVFTNESVSPHQIQMFELTNIGGGTSISGPTIVSKATTGITTTTGSSANPVISADGRYVAFESDATDLVAGDTNGRPDIFVYDIDTDTMERVSINHDGTQTENADAANASISADGRYVAYQSDAKNILSVTDGNSQDDIFVYDRQTGDVERVSEGTGGVEGDGASRDPQISANGRWIAFRSFSTNWNSGGNAFSDIWYHDRQTDETVLVSYNDNGEEGDRNSLNPAISGDGSTVAFVSAGDKFVVPDDHDTNGFTGTDVYVRVLGTDCAPVESVVLSSLYTDDKAGTSLPDLYIEWVGNNNPSHDVWYSATDFYFAPGDAGSTLLSTETDDDATHVDALDGSTNYSYVVNATGGCGDTELASWRVGTFNFAITPGD